MNNCVRMYVCLYGRRHETTEKQEKENTCEFIKI